MSEFSDLLKIRPNFVMFPQGIGIVCTSQFKIVFDHSHIYYLFLDKYLFHLILLQIGKGHRYIFCADFPSELSCYQDFINVTQHWIDKTPPTYMVWTNWYAKHSFAIDPHHSISLADVHQFEQPNTGRQKIKHVKPLASPPLIFTFN